MALDTGSEINGRNDNTVKGFIGFVDYAKSLYDQKRQPETELTKMENYDSPCS